MSQTEKLGYRIHVMVHTLLIEGNRLGMLADYMCRQVGMTLLCMCENFSHLKGEADDHDIIR